MISLAFIILVSFIIIAIICISITITIIAINGNNIRNTFEKTDLELNNIKNSTNISSNDIYNLDNELSSFTMLGPQTSGVETVSFNSIIGANISGVTIDFNWIKHGNKVTMWWDDKNLGNFTISSETSFSNPIFIPSELRPTHDYVHPIRIKSGIFTYNSYMKFNANGLIQIFAFYTNGSTFSTGEAIIYASTCSYES